MAEEGRAVSLRPRFPSLSIPQPGSSATASSRGIRLEALMSSPRDLDGSLGPPDVPDHVVVAAGRIPEKVLVEVLHRVSGQDSSEGVGESGAGGVALGPGGEVARRVRSVPSILGRVAVLVAGEDLQLV